LITLRIGILITIKNLRKRGYNYRNIVFAGWDGISNQYYDVIHLDLASGYKILGYFEDKLIENVPINYLGDINSLKDFFKKDNIDELFISSQSFSKEQVKELVLICEANMTRIRFIPNVIQYGVTSNFDVVRYGHLPTFSLRKEPMEKLVNRIIKRTFDIVFSSLVLIFIFSWLYPIIAILIKFSSKGPVFFKQLRSGENNHTFYCYKFRTMKVNAQSDKLQATKEDSRITKIGAFLRKTSMDELPQFFNVFLGSMSVVGPRPHMVMHTEQYSNDINNFMVRHYIKPGITGWAQVNGHRGETKKLEDMEKRVRYDIWYLENWNIFFDFKIIYLTILNVVYGDSNAY
jgi:undecaprenyl-phosphate galactose phosphotransferase/putative colanic acid biosynthesis UDP-glucose lipid carrier transferase